MLKDHIFLYGGSPYRRKELAEYIEQNYKPNAKITSFLSPVYEYTNDLYNIDSKLAKYYKLVQDNKDKLLRHFGKDLLVDTLFKKVRKFTPITEVSGFNGFIVYDGYSNKHIDHNYLKIWLDDPEDKIFRLNLKDKCDIIISGDRPYEKQNFNFLYQDFYKEDNYFGNLGKKSVFVYETNLAGINSTPSSKIAQEYYKVEKTHFNHLFKSNSGTLCYAIVTKDCNNVTLPEELLKQHIDIFLKLVANSPKLTFYLSDLEAFNISAISNYFNSIPSNVKVSYKLQKYINN